MATKAALFTSMDETGNRVMKAAPAGGAAKPAAAPAATAKKK